MDVDPKADIDLEGVEGRERLSVSRTSFKTIALTVAIATTALALDVSLPLGVAGGVPYVALILVGWWFPERWTIILLAAIASVLTVVGYSLSPEGSIPWVVFTNRFYALFAIWVTAVTLMVARQDRELIRQSEANLKGAMHRVETANMAKTTFLAAASHDLRQPLQAAHLFLSALSAEVHQPKSRELIAHLNVSISALGNLLDSLLDLSRLEAGLVKVHLQPLSLSKLMHRITEEFSVAAKEKGLEIRLVTTKLTAYSDPVLLENILRNLLSNAVKHTKNGNILLGCRRRGNSISLEVWDNGCGIPKDRLKDIFEEFVQIGNEGRDRSKGLGLGLSIVERLAKLLDHRIDVRSWEGNGSAFAIKLPLAHEEAVSDQLEENPATKSLAKTSVFVIDDEPAIRTGLSLVLEENGYKTHATSGHECEKCKKITSEMASPPDIILADLRLQRGNTGFDAIKCLRETFKEDIPAILLTGDTAPDRLTEAKKSGLQILHKPISVDDLLRAISNTVKAE